MHNVTLICTRHIELGKCNSEELYKIIERIKPEVIFEELPSSSYDERYVTKTRRSLESVTINRYLANYPIKQVLVDSDRFPAEELSRKHDLVNSIIAGLSDVNGFKYKKCQCEYELKVEKYGFQFLNSEQCILIKEEIKKAIKGGLEKVNGASLSAFYDSWIEVMEQRENEMLRNIYAYSRSNNYHQAIFLIGASHRKSVIEKISVFQEKEKVKLNWVY